MLRNGSEFHNYPQPQPPTKTEKNMQKAGCDNADQQLIQCPGQWSALVELDLLQTCKLNVPKTQGNFFGERKNNEAPSNDLNPSRFGKLYSPSNYPAPSFTNHAKNLPLQAWKIEPKSPHPGALSCQHLVVHWPAKYPPSPMPRKYSP